MDLRKEFFRNPKRLIKKIRIRNSPWEDAKNKEILEDLANKVEIFEMREKLKKGFADFKTDTARKLYSKESKEGFANLRKLSQFHLIDKKEGKLVDVIQMEDGSLIRGKEKDKIILQEF